MNNKRSVIWLVLGCIISIMKARLMALQNRFETIVKKVLETMNRIRTVFQRLSGRIVIALSFLSAMAGPVLASATQDATYDLFKLAIQPFLDLLTWPVIPAAVALSLLTALVAPVSGESGEVAKKQAVHFVTWGIYVEIFLVIFWAFMKVVGMLGGHSAT